MRRHTNNRLDGTLPPQSLLTPPTPTRCLAWTLSQAKPVLHTTLGQRGQPREASSVSTRPGLIPRRGRNPLERKGGCWQCRQVQGLPSRPTCSYTPLPAFLIILPSINRPVPLPLQQGGRNPVSSSFYLPSSSPTNRRTWGPLELHMVVPS